MAPSLKIGFYGGAGEVTGSRYLVESDGSKVLLDCGLFQGHRKESIRKNRELPFAPADLDAVLLSHAHIDHSGGLPVLPARGFKRKVHCTRPTFDLCSVMLADSGRLQEEDAKFFNKIHAAEGLSIEPLYTEEDAREALSRFVSERYEAAFEPVPGVRATFHNAGHVLGSAMTLLEVPGPGGRRRILFTGDLGRRKTILMHPPGLPRDVDVLLVESTYGDRVHQPISLVEEQLTEVVRRAVSERGKILIPSFALERTQEIVFVLEKLARQKTIPRVPLYVDSPMAVDISQIFNRHLDCFSFSPEFREYVAEEGDPFGFETVHYVRTADESKGLNDLPGPMIILSASGMCEGGRVLHHLRNNIGDERTTILIVGYQAEGTLGRRLVDGAPKVKIFGLEHEVFARVQTMHTFSSHADKEDLLWFISGLQPRPRRIFLVHGDQEDRLALAGHLKSLGIDNVTLPNHAEVVNLESRQGTGPGS